MVTHFNKKSCNIIHITMHSIYITAWELTYNYYYINITKKNTLFDSKILLIRYHLFLEWSPQFQKHHRINPVIDPSEKRPSSDRKASNIINPLTAAYPTKNPSLSRIQPTVVFDRRIYIPTLSEMSRYQTLQSMVSKIMCHGNICTALC